MDSPLKLTYPALYDAADKASGRGQTLHLRLMGGQLVALLFAGMLSIWDQQWTAIVTAVIFAFTMLLWAILQTMRPASNWFDGRAIAESLKSLSWKFAMRAPPFNDSASDDDAEKRYREEYHGILSERRELGAQLVSIGQPPPDRDPRYGGYPRAAPRGSRPPLSRRASA